MRAPRRLVLIAAAAAVAGSALSTLGDAELRRPPEPAASALAGPPVGLASRATAAAVVDGRPASEAEAPSPGSAARSAAAALGPGPGAASETAVERERAARDALAAGSDPGPRVALEPLVIEAGRVSAPLRGDDPAGPRPLVLWRVVDGRAARAAEGTSRSDGSLVFPEVLLAGRGELLVTGARVGADLAARLPGDRIAVPAPRPSEAGEDTMQGSSELEATR